MNEQTAREALQVYENINYQRTAIAAIERARAMTSQITVSFNGRTEHGNFDMLFKREWHSPVEGSELAKAILAHFESLYRAKLRELGRRLAQLNYDVPEDCRQ